MTAATPRVAPERLVWLDLARVICAIMIIGFHWIRATYKVGLLDLSSPNNVVMEYQHQPGIAAAIGQVLVGGTAHSLATWLTNLIGVLGLFGWEAVSALILISGFSLAMAQRGKVLRREDWLSWYGKRAKRILIPFYVIALPFLLLYELALLIVPHFHSHIAAVIDAKLLSQFHTPPLGVIMSHIVLFDPFARQWSADFFAPAWWFVPAILLAYAAYPFIRSLSAAGRGIPLLAGAACISIAAYVCSELQMLTNETWYFIVLHELFNFCVGIVVGQAWLAGGRAAIERIMFNPYVFALALGVFAVAQLANWSPGVRPLASLLYGPSLVLIVVFVGKSLEKWRFAHVLTNADSYDLYLVHQPFAFPLALAAKAALHGYGVFIGWFAFFGVTWIAAKILGNAYRPLFNLRFKRQPDAIGPRFSEQAQS